jgi:transcriptional regulator with XRE-family HTH domain
LRFVTTEYTSKKSKSIRFETKIDNLTRLLLRFVTNVIIILAKGVEDDMSDKHIDKQVFSERLKEVMKDNNETMYTLADKLSLSPATISRYSTGKMAPKLTTIDVIAREFDINPVWLMGHDVEKHLESQEEKKPYYKLTEKDKLDVAKELEKMLEGLSDSNGFAAFDGEPLDEATKMVLKDSLERSMLLAREISKKKFTPKKYRD